jgi:hypothetical protein
MSYFRICSTCMSRSQAPLCHCTRNMIANHVEGTLEVLRYFLGGDRPSQTDPLTLFLARFHGTRLEFRLIKTGISLMARPSLTRRLPSLPAMLHMTNQNPMPNYSKGARGLSVLLRESGIFTGITTSPRSSLRQRLDRYTIRAGRNLPDKEFRYLRTVIVTADIHRGFGSELSPLALTFRHWSRVTLYTSYCKFAECCVFVKQSPKPIHCAFPELP